MRAWKNIIFIAMACGLISGCKSVDEHIAERSGEIIQYYPSVSSDPEDLPAFELDWDTAVSMLGSNLVMRNAAEEIIKSKVAVKRVFLDLIPQLTVQGIYQQSITSITELTSDNFNANINALFAVPGLLRLRLDYYGAMLAVYSARQQYKLAYRDEVINLYTLFRKHQHNRAQYVVESLQSADPTFGRADRQELAFVRNQRETALWLGLSAALGNYSNRWMIVSGNVPKHDYLSTAPDWDDPEEAGKLFITLEAVELEAARLRELGVKFQYWPQLNMRVYSPSVYLLSGGDRGGFEFDADDIRFEAGVTMKLDTNLKIRDQLRETRRNTELLKQKLFEDAHERAKKLDEAQDALAVIDTRMTQLQAKKKLLNTLPQSSAYDVFEKNLSEHIELLNQLIALEQELDSIIPILWVADESKWRVEDEAVLAD